MKYKRAKEKGEYIFSLGRRKKIEVENNKQKLPSKQRGGRGKRKMQKGRTEKWANRKAEVVLEEESLLDITQIFNDYNFSVEL